MLAVLSIMVPGYAMAQTESVAVCLDFTSYCDGIEVVVQDNGMIVGTWVNTDCAGTDVPINGGKIFNGPVGYGAYLTANNIGYLWGWFVDIFPDGTMDMYINDGVGWSMWIDELDYAIIPGPCNFSNSESGQSSASAWPQ